MNYLQIIDLKDEKKWDSIVKSFRGYDVCYLHAYANSFFLHGDGRPFLLYYEDGSTRAINVVMVRDISASKQFEGILEEGKWFDLSSPYGYGGFLVEGDNYEAVNRAYDEYCREKGYVCEFVRFHLLSIHKEHYNGVTETHTHNIIRSLELAPKDMLMDFEHKVRKNIKKAINSGLDILIDTTGEHLQDFLNIYYNTMSRTGANGNFYFNSQFFEALQLMKDHYVYFHVLYENRIISTELALYGNENCYSFLGGTDSQFFSLRPNDFLKYEIIKWAQENGLKRFILGGGYGEDDGIYQYKKSFAPNGVFNFYVGKKIFYQDKYDQLMKLRGFITEEHRNIRYFPQYRG